MSSSSFLLCSTPPPSSYLYWYHDDDYNCHLLSPPSSVYAYKEVSDSVSGQEEIFYPINIKNPMQDM